MNYKGFLSTGELYENNVIRKFKSHVTTNIRQTIL